MPSKKTIKRLEYLFESVGFVRPAMPVLIIRAQQFWIVGSRAVEESDARIMELTDRQCKDGLTQIEWSALFQKINSIPEVEYDG